MVKKRTSISWTISPVLHLLNLVCVYMHLHAHVVSILHFIVFNIGINIGTSFFKIKDNFLVVRHWNSTALFCPMPHLSLWMPVLSKASQTNKIPKLKIFILLMSLYLVCSIDVTSVVCFHKSLSEEATNYSQKKNPSTLLLFMTS